MPKIDSILKEVLEKINPPEEELSKIEKSLNQFTKKLEVKIKQKKINAKIFLGGSYAKKTLHIKKDRYDIDIFLRFDKTEEDISKITAQLLKNSKIKFVTLKGSRDYFQVKASPKLSFEIVPVIAVKNPKNAENITDLSYSHVQYILKKIKTQKILDDIKLAKDFCYAQKCYGAESYIHGFSGYSLELLVYYYKSFLNFIKAVAGANSGQKILIDIEKYYKKKSQILLDINEAKLQSPIIIIDPTYKQRNVLAALSAETFERFQQSCKKFLKNPSVKFFERTEVNFEELKKQARKNNYQFVIVEIKTNKQSGDIAGSKLKKFCLHFESEIKKYFEIKASEFDYHQEQNAQIFLSVKPKKDILVPGPKISDKENVRSFKKSHKNTFAKSGRIFAKEKINFSLKSFIGKWKNKNAKKVRDMSINWLRVS